jgi:hypothetical protein
MGNLSVVWLISLMSEIHPLCDSMVLALRPINLTPRRVNSGSSLAKAPSSEDSQHFWLVHCLSYSFEERLDGNGKGKSPTGCAYWCVVFRMREENHPAVADKFMEIDRACGGVGLEVWSFASEAESMRWMISISLSSGEESSSVVVGLGGGVAS